MKKIILVALTLLLAACETAPGAYVPPAFAFEAAAARTVNVHEIRIIEGYQSPLKKPYMEQDFLVTPNAAVKQWVARRLRANPTISANSVLEVTISDASVKETPLKKTEGVKGLFTDDQDARYDARIVVTFRLFAGGNIASSATADVEVSRYVTINEKATVFDRQRIYHQMLDKMMVDFDREANARLTTYFATVVR